MRRIQVDPEFFPSLFFEVWCTVCWLSYLYYPTLLPRLQPFFLALVGSR